MAQLSYVAGTAKICDVGRIVSLRFDVNTPGSYFEPYMGAAPTLTDGDRTITLVPLGATFDVSGGKLQWDVYLEVPISEAHIEVGDAATWDLEWGTALASDGTHSTPATGTVQVSNTSVVGSDGLKSFTGTPAATYYVSGRSGSSDSNNGTSQGSAWRQPSKAISYINANHAGGYVVVYVEKGYRYAGAGNITVAGSANRSPILFIANGSGADPIIDVAGDGGFSSGSTHNVSNFHIRGMRLQCSGGSAGLAFFGYSGAGNIWLERCSIQGSGAGQFFGNLFSLQHNIPSGDPMTNSLQGVRVHECIGCDAYGHHGQGEYGYRAPFNRFTRCIMDHCGYEVVGGTEFPITYGHTQYRHGGCHNLQMYSCSFTRSGCNGFSSNSKAAVFIRCFGMANPCGIHVRRMGHCGAFLCIIEAGANTNNSTSEPRAYGIGCQSNTKWPNNDPVNDANNTSGAMVLRLCWFINKSTNTGDNAGIECLDDIIDGSANRLMIDGCGVKNWGGGKAMIRTDPNPNPNPNTRLRADQESLLPMVHVRNSTFDMRTATGERTCFEFQTTFATWNRIRFSGTNRYITSGNAKFRLDGTPISDATWLAHDTGAVFTAPNYPDGTRGFPRYCVEVLGLADVSAYYAAIRSMSMASFNVLFTQAAYWVLAGLTDEVEDPIDAGGPTLAPEYEFTDPNGNTWTSGDVAYTQNAIKFGENVAESIRIQNKGSGTLHGVTITLGGSLTSAVAFPDELDLTPGQLIDVPITLVCQSAGSKSGTVTVASTELDDQVMTITWTVPSGVLAAPTNVRATAGNAAASVTCDAQAGATGYKVLYGTTNGSAYNTTISSSGPNIPITGLANGTTYYAVMRAVNAQGDSANSAQVSFTPAAPSGNGPLGSIKSWLIAGVRSVKATMGIWR